MNQTILHTALRVTKSILLAMGMIVAVIVMSTAAHAQIEPVTVSALRGITYGTMYRSSSSFVNYTSSSAAEFAVVGRQNKQVRITVTYSALRRGTSTLAETIRQLDCAYSIDEGVTWIRFTTGTLFQDLEFPNGTANGSTSGTVRVRIGGTATSTSTQQRGGYQGTITVSAVYR